MLFIKKSQAALAASIIKQMPKDVRSSQIMKTETLSVAVIATCSDVLEIPYYRRVVTSVVPDWATTVRVIITCGDIDTPPAILL